MEVIVRYHGHMLQTLFQKGQDFEATYQQQLCPLPSTVSTLNGPQLKLLSRATKRCHIVAYSRLFKCHSIVTLWLTRVYLNAILFRRLQ